MDRFSIKVRCVAESRVIRLCTALLTILWVVSGVCEFPHDAVHSTEHEAGDYAHRVGMDPQLTWVPAHRHGHVHESALSDAQMVKVPKLEAQALLIAVRDVDAPAASARGSVRPISARAGPGRAAAHGPRAPPIS